MAEDKDKSAKEKSEEKKADEEPKKAMAGKDARKAEPEAKTEPKPEPSSEEPDMSEAQQKAKEIASKAGEGAKKIGHGAASISKAVWADPLVCVRRIDGLVSSARDFLPPDLFDMISSIFVKVGHVAMCIAVPVTLVFGVLGAMTEDETTTFAFRCAVAAVVLLAAQYAAHKFLNAGKTLVEQSPTTLGSGAFLDCVAILSEAFGIYLLIMFAVMAGRQGSFLPLGMGIGLWVVCGAVTYVALHPALINTSISEASTAGNEAIGMISFFAKAMMRLVPVAFGVGTAIGTVILLFVTIGVLKTGEEAIDAGKIAISYVAVSALLPLTGYVLFAFYCLLIDLLRAILSLVERD